MQWFRGELEASYVGTPHAQPFYGTRASATHYMLHVYRAALKNLERIEPPVADATLPSQTQVFRQARVDDALIAGVRGPGTRYHGPVFELCVSDATFSHPVQKDGRAYGRLTGRAVLCCELPPEPERPAVETTLVTSAAPEDVPMPLRAELHQVPDPDAEGSSQSAAAPANPQRDHRAEAREQNLGGLELAEAPARAATRRTDSAAPLFALTAAVALGLWAGCGAQPALLWCLFLAPTLLARKLFHGILNDSPYIRGFGAVLAIGQLLCVSTLVSEWWSVPCKELHLLPLIGIVVVIFPAGLLPSVVPLVFNAAGLALVLSVWCGGAGSACVKARPQPASFAPASVEHPGVPRTNEDGTWPRRPPGR
jgi:hypothetical protein